MKKNENSIELFSTISPENLNQRLLEIGVKENFIKNHFVKYFYIIHRIYSHDVFNKNENECRLHSEILRSLLGSYYSSILNHLITIGIVQLSSNYLAGGRSNGYSLVEDKGAILYQFENKHRFVKKILKIDQPNVQNGTQTLSRLYRSLSNLEYDHIDKDSLSESEKKFIHFLENDLFQTVGERGKRIYNNFCNLPKTLRSKLMLNNEELTFVDIVNSQMIFLGSVIKETLEKQGKNIDSSTSVFIKNASTGKLYELLMHECEVVNRSELKDQIFKIIFGKNSFSKIISKKFNKLFPQVIEVIKYLKQEDYRILSHQMQQMEAKVVFRALDSIDFEKDILTVHDSLYAPKSEKNTILEALVNSFKCEGLEAVINVNDEYSTRVFEYDDFANKIDKILSGTPRMNDETENRTIMVDFGSDEYDAVEDEMKFLKHCSVKEINFYLEFYKFSERITSRSDIDIIRKLARKKVMALLDTSINSLGSDDDFDDLPF
ncbi:hypothetical protein MM239_12365 [Belliella sp. DSM 111904]|uniref:Uncharacterized protein n=1 Tax=Belliella filtrata TaxID=2923435 RepID=A0ABS9V1B3_9BACT|nr:hypothetical protein [Belliella filtrata]MCH7410193.1 hypothetical protein [Belliella filtrata]